MFQFNFDVEEETINEPQSTDYVKISKCSDPDLTDSLIWYDSKRVMPDREILETVDICTLNSIEMKIGNISLVYAIPKYVLQTIYPDLHGTTAIKDADENHTDLIPGTYEGGAKIWECTEDLLHYLSTHVTDDTWKTKKVLDLGCGSGLLGIYALKLGSIVHFQDYNEDVLKNITIPNVVLNYGKLPLKDEDVVTVNNIAKFYSGDWSKFARLEENENNFHFILTSETIYNPANHQKLLDTFALKLASDGVVFVAAKTYYFGVGGGLRQFENLVKSDGRFDCKSVWANPSGLSREIIELRRLY